MMKYKWDDMSDFICKLPTLVNQLLSAGCTSNQDDKKIFLLLNTVWMVYHPFRMSITYCAFSDLRRGIIQNESGT